MSSLQKNHFLSVQAKIFKGCVILCVATLGAKLENAETEYLKAFQDIYLKSGIT